MTIVLLPAFRSHVTNEWLPFVCSFLALFVLVFSGLRSIVMRFVNE